MTMEEATVGFAAVTSMLRSDFARPPPIVCGFDFTRRARLAAWSAARLATSLEAELVIAHAATVPPEAALRRLVQRRSCEVVGAAAGVVVVEQGSAAALLARVAQERNAALLVIGGGVPGRGMALAPRVVRRCATPVLMINDAVPVELWLRRARRLRVLVAASVVDATSLAERLRFLRALAPCDVTLVQRAVTSGEDADATNEREILAAFSAVPGAGALRVLSWSRAHRESATAILDAAEEVAADLIVVGDDPAAQATLDATLQGSSNMLLAPVSASPSGAWS